MPELARWQFFHFSAAERFGFDDFHRHAWYRPSDGAFAHARFVAVDAAARRDVHGHERREFRAAVGFKRPNAKFLLERVEHLRRSSLGGGKHDVERAEIFRGAAFQIGSREGGRGHEHGGAMLAAKLADLLRIERIEMIDPLGLER